MKYILLKIKNQSGLSLVELMATVVLIGIMGLALVAGIGTVQKTYGQVVRKANEQTLLHTTLIEIRDAIQKSVDYKVVNGKVTRFKSKDGYWFMFSNNAKGVYIDFYYPVAGTDEIGSQTISRPVVSNKNGEISGIHSVFDVDNITVSDNGCICIKNLRVIGGDGKGTELMADGDKTYYIRVFAN